ncbi:MAG: COX15/CtaA family protein [Actinomycetia bacterium]|nr:COX15/CtaA family protein [Actinomycetes bacterium]
MPELTQRRRRVFAFAAWATLAFNILVILGGTIVRATGSGDGCGDTWPKCGDQFIPPNATVETLIEFSHRVSSFLAGVGVASLVVLALWFFAKGHLVRKAAIVSGVVLVIEALLGAALVVFGWVDADVSVGRLIVVPLHLTNTFLLLGSLAVTAWWGSGNPLPTHWPDRSTMRWLVGGALVIVVLGATGALNALADTIFPSDTVTGNLTEKFGPTAPLLSNLRIIHPILGIVGGLLVGWIASSRSRFGSPMTRRMASTVTILVLSQFFIGVANIFLLTPLSLQVLHLMVADLLWVAYIILAVSLIGDGVTSRTKQRVSA